MSTAGDAAYLARASKTTPRHHLPHAVDITTFYIVHAAATQAAGQASTLRGYIQIIRSSKVYTMSRVVVVALMITRGKDIG